MALSVAMLVAGLAILSVAADRFVVAAARMSKRFGVSPILIGALVVGMGTSAPELLVSILAAANGELNLAVGNAVGSDVANVTLVIGVTALFSPLAGSTRILRREGVAMMIGVLMLAVMLYDLHLSRIEGSMLLGAMAVAAILIVRWARADMQQQRDAPPPDPDQAKDEDDDGGDDIDLPVDQIQPGKEIGLGLLSLLATLTGAELLVTGGTQLAEGLGVGSAFIGMTLVAVGTSLPELATSIAGVRRHQDDMVVGNVLGSNLFNALAVAGTAATLSPGDVEPRFRLASMIMVSAALLSGWFAVTGRKVVRWEGMLLLVGFIGFVIVSYTSGL